MQKYVSGDCANCESTYNIEYMETMVSQELPEHCPFCGEVIEELSESYIEDEDDFDDDEKWDRC
jgi:NAD-dependent SIR2 family protein deacetylase